MASPLMIATSPDPISFFAIFTGPSAMIWLFAAAMCMMRPAELSDWSNEITGMPAAIARFRAGTRAVASFAVIMIASTCCAIRLLMISTCPSADLVVGPTKMICVSPICLAA